MGLVRAYASPKWDSSGDFADELQKCNLSGIGEQIKFISKNYNQSFFRIGL